MAQTTHPVGIHSFYGMGIKYLHLPLSQKIPKFALQPMET